MKQFEQQQMEHSKRRLRIDIATQGEGINPMAPFSQDVDKHRGCVSSNEGVTFQNPEPPVTVSAPPHPEFRLATPGQQFGFRLPEAASQLESYMRAPTLAPHPSGDPAPENVVYSCPPSAAAPSQPQPNQVAPRPSGNPAPENVVNIHCQRNRAPRLPSNLWLLASRRQQQALSIDRTADEVQSNGNADGQDNPSVNHSVGDVTERSERAEPWQLQYYELSTQDIIERAKQFSHCDAASINPFPIRAKFNSKAIEYIDKAIAERQLCGLLVSDSWWPQNTSNILRLGHVNNLAHPALSGLIVDFFYTGPTFIGTLFPEVFVGEVLRVTVAFEVTALKVVLDEVAAGQGEVNFWVNTYLPVYTEILGLMSKCDTNVIHRDKTKALRKRWAQLRSNGMSNQELVAGDCGFDVDLN
ncbi:hypothetical protein OG21DRAFT_1489080 [Imleria badia]|nr:hypothetical protein OG21DRAFT_1489080 [Imleria badia]